MVFEHRVELAVEPREITAVAATDRLLHRVRESPQARDPGGAEMRRGDGRGIALDDREQVDHRLDELRIRWCDTGTRVPSEHDQPLGLHASHRLAHG